MQSGHDLDVTSPEFLRAVVEQVPQALIFADCEGTIRVWNRAAEAIFGYAAAEVLGKNLDVIIPERLRSAHWAGFHKAVQTGQTRHSGRVMRTRSMHKDGRKLYVNLSFTLLKDPAGAVLGAVATGLECTDP